MKTSPVVLQTGFRIFFLGAAIYSVVSILLWMSFYILNFNIFVGLPISLWHGHEMIYGFTMAVVAGFLLTAVTNWTGQKTLEGFPLLILFLLWLAARIFAFMPEGKPVLFLAMCNILFLLFLIVSVARPIIKIKQWRQLAVLSKIVLLFLSGIYFYYGIFTQQLEHSHRALVFSLYMVVSLILTISRRIIPFFVEKGVGYPVTLKNSKVLDLSSLLLLIIFSIVDVFFSQWKIIPVLAFLLVCVHSVRLKGWYTKGIWQKPLLWILFVGYFFLIVGFALKFISWFYEISPESIIHAFTYGGIGTFILGMMARVSLGHTGRNIHDLPKGGIWMFVVFVIGACFRVFLPMVDDSLYVVWIVLSQFLWMISFVLFLWIYFPILVSKRSDGKAG